MADLLARLRIPVVAAPMLGVSGPDLVAAACRAGVAGAFPSANCASSGQLAEWLAEIDEAVGSSTEHPPGPVCVNLIVHRTNPRLAEDLETVLASRADVVITSVGSPEGLVAELHRAGKQVWADVASLRHVDRAGAAGVDGMVLLTAGAGGQTGWANPFAFVRAARARFDGLIAVAGGIGDGVSVAAARLLGADLAYCGTRFIATSESMASAEYKQALAAADLDDVVLTDEVTGLPANMLRGSLETATEAAATVGRVPVVAGGTGSGRFDVATSLPGANGRPSRWAAVQSAGHGVSGVRDIPAVADLVDMLEREYRAAVPNP